MSGSARILVEDLPQRRGDTRGDLGPFGVPRLRGSDWSFPPQGGTPNEGVRNEANLPARTEMGAGGRRCPRRRRWGSLRQTNPISPSQPEKTLAAKATSTTDPRSSAPNKANSRTNGSGQGSARRTVAPARPSAPNKANLPRTGQKFYRRRGQVYKTKPIPRRRAGKGQGRQGRPCRHGRAETCETKPIPGWKRPGRGRQGCPCHRWERSCETKPIWPRVDPKRHFQRWGQTCETKPIPPERPERQRG